MAVLTSAPTQKNSPGTAIQDKVTISVSSLKAGVRLRAPIFEGRADRDVLLLAAGTVLNSKTLQNLTQRGVTQVRVDASEKSRLTGGSTPARPPAVVSEPDRTTASRYGISTESHIHKVARHHAGRYDVQQVAAFSSGYQTAVATISTLFSGLTSGVVNDAPELAAVSADSLVKITQDLDLFVALGAKPTSSDDLSQHSTQVAMMAMSIGTMLGLKPNDLIELGVGCLIHDTGMLMLRRNVHEAARRLTQLEFLEVTKHPAITYDMLTRLRDVPTGSRMVAYQMHERCDGSGYPRGRQAAQIHPLSKIAAVADVYVALVSDRPWRRGMLPYSAMERIIRSTREGLFDAEVVRALLRTVSLFPIGSCVQTSDGRVGTVVRTNRELFTRPIVELWQPGNSSVAEVVDLSKEPSLEVTRPLDATNAAITSQVKAIDTDFWE